ncbi:MAG: hypothetical protein B7Z29_19370 [Hyphomicrobium sp. 12-62-95]|nr:MAG: hypothetical protein B7Z29_19370 [Hyphomicrobium sp. 12-62-95]
MFLPIAIGSLFASCFPAATARLGPALKLASSALVLAILATALWSVRGSLDTYIKEMLICCTLFTFGAMFAGGLLGAWNSDSDRTVLTIEAGTRNVGVALLLGGTAHSRPDFGVFASFMSVYFAVEVTIMLTYANWRASKVKQEPLPARRDGRRED